jgi:TadE-like protein
MKRRNARRGSVLVEFSLAGIAAIFLILFTFNLSMAMWNYHTLAFAVHEGTRYIAVKGKGCTQPGNTCGATVGMLAQKIASVGIGIPSGQVNASFTTDSGAVTSCAPLSSCFTNATVWPPSTNQDNKVGRIVTIAAKYQFRSPLVFFWPGKTGGTMGAVWLPASSTQKIMF